MKLVIVESPYTGDTATHVTYARRALRDSLDRGEAPLASHLLHTQVLDDTQPQQRNIGIGAGLAWTRVADLMAIYTDLGITAGMQQAINRAAEVGLPVEHRTIGGGL